MPDPLAGIAARLADPAALGLKELDERIAATSDGFERAALKMEAASRRLAERVGADYRRAADRAEAESRRAMRELSAGFALAPLVPAMQRDAERIGRIYAQVTEYARAQAARATAINAEYARSRALLFEQPNGYQAFPAAKLLPGHAPLGHPAGDADRAREVMTEQARADAGRRAEQLRQAPMAHTRASLDAAAAERRREEQFNAQQRAADLRVLGNRTAAEVRNQARVELEARRAEEREQRRTADAVKLIGHQDRLGKSVGSAVAALERSGVGRGAAAAGGLAARGGAAGFGMAVAGAQDTVDFYQLSNELRLFSRELGATVTPLLNFATRQAREARKVMEGLSASQQDWVGRALGVAGGAAALRLLGGGPLLAGAGRMAMNPYALALGSAAAHAGIQGFRTRDTFAARDDLRDNRDRRRAGDLTAKEYDETGYEKDIRGIKDPVRRAAAIRAERDKLQKEQAKLREGSTGTFGGLRSGLGTFGPLIPGGGGLSAMFGGVDVRDTARGQAQIDKKFGALARLDEEARGGRAFKPKAGENDHRTPMLAQAGYNQAGGTFEEMQVELLKLSAGGEKERTQEDLLQDILKAIESNSAEAMAEKLAGLITGAVGGALGAVKLLPG